MFDNLNEDNFVLFAMKHYENPNCTDVLEFYDDLKRIRYIKRLLTKYKESGELKERLILNHLILLYNIFDSRAMTRMLIFRLEDQLDCLKPFLLLLGRWTVDIGLVDGRVFNDSEISLDPNIVKILRQI